MLNNLVLVDLHKELLANNYEHKFASGEIVNGSHKYVTYKHSRTGREITFVRRESYGSDYLIEMKMNYSLEFVFAV